MSQVDSPYSHLAFAGDQRIARGALDEVALAIRAAADAGERRPIIVLDAVSSQTVDLDLRGTAEEIVARLASEPSAAGGDSASASEARATGPGRPRLGVVSREISLLPRHWDWLKTQRGGASAALRRLVDEARRHSGAQDRFAAARESVDRYLRVMGGDRPNYEEALRAFYAGRDTDLRRLVADWPGDVRDHLDELLRHCRELAPA
jgi:hypothetical protein